MCVAVTGLVETPFASFAYLAESKLWLDEEIARLKAASSTKKAGKKDSSKLLVVKGRLFAILEAQQKKLQVVYDSFDDNWRPILDRLSTGTDKDNFKNFLKYKVRVKEALDSYEKAVRHCQ
jgi:hypothetical protein